MQVEALIDCQRLQPLALPKEATEGAMSLREATAGGALLSTELALMWRVVCTWLQVPSAFPCSHDKTQPDTPFLPSLLL